ncbi:hypothetical protein ASPZODRAFT_157569 [Penicilliopsis zonata CBS 506.65]|uniref:DH domain-containing protein n=1 Tax=Penicilliopsis zonata CBS 506.65 TaxID=1073090 RepID=A0A1L9SPR0_9EURO|nr:hypothetical protein ASPZODRAFT_157569 [Penicilliopsis zonata CBS 506.65]OJJ49106.1 hypothetical protein ASPZODRAFT_157569 [Penicilliopsis zonata CBS 506.65]
MGSETDAETEEPYPFYDISRFETKGEEAVAGSEREAPASAFKRWMSTFRSKRPVLSQTQERVVEGWPQDPETFGNRIIPPHNGFQEQQWEDMSGRSSSFLGTINTASISVATQSVIRSRANTHSTTNQSTRSDIRPSFDSLRPTLSIPLDDAAQNRSIQRRQVLNEILRTESEYVAGLRALTEILAMFLTRPELYYNLEQIRGIHEKFLVQLQNLIRSSDPAMLDAPFAQSSHKKLPFMELSGFKRMPSQSWKIHNPRHLYDTRVSVAIAGPYEALEVAREIENLSISFVAYERFCTTYEVLAEDLSILRRSVPNWQLFDRGIEALSKSAASIEGCRQEDSKSMTLNDLLIKPIQRLCRYTLLIQDLLKNTTASDCQSSHDGIYQALENVRAVVARVNAATGNPVNKDRARKTILLQEKLHFARMCPLQNIFRQLGPIIQCGVLYVTYNCPGQVTGDYMVSALFNRHFLLAQWSDDQRRLQAIACLCISDMKIDILENGKGIFCDWSLFSWKLSFHHIDKGYEFVLSASSAAEEMQWKTEIIKLAAILSDEPKDGPSKIVRCSFLSLNLVAVDSPLQPAPSLVRKASASALTTLRSDHQRDMLHVRIKKTHFPRGSEETAAQPDGEIERPKVLSSARSILTLTPRREDRIRLEKFISIIYTRDVLPFPGMSLGAADRFTRTTSRLIRRISSHANFSRRSTSLTVTQTGSIDEEICSPSSSNGSQKAKRATDSSLISKKKKSPFAVGVRNTFSLRNRKKPRSRTEIIRLLTENEDAV